MCEVWGDKFKVTYTANDGVTASIDVTVGAEKTQAELDKEAADAQEKAEVAAKAEANAKINTYADALTAKAQDDATIDQSNGYELDLTGYNDVSVNVTGDNSSNG